MNPYAAAAALVTLLPTTPLTGADVTVLATMILVAHSLPIESLVPGGVAIIKLQAGDEDGYRFMDRPVLVTQIDGEPTALVGLPLSLKAGEHFIEKRDSGKVHRKYFEVAHKEYTTQHI